jgi:hypothetical protein
MTKLPEIKSDDEPKVVEEGDWIKPRIESFLPAKAAEGIGYGDQARRGGFALPFGSAVSATRCPTPC